MAKVTVYKGAETEITGVPDTVKLLPYGLVKSQKGDFTVDDESLADIQKQFKGRGVDLVIDYEHQTLKDVQAPAAGWIKDIVKDGNAIAAKVEWTPQGRKYLENKEYRYLSPVVVVRLSDDKAVALHSVALTNTPAIDGMFAIVNSLDLTDYETDIDQKGETSTMDTGELIKKIAALLGLDENTPPEQVVQTLADTLSQTQAMKDSADKTVANKTICGLLGLQPGAKTEDAAAAIMALKTPSTDTVSKADFQALQLKLAQRDADESVTKAMKAGKLCAAQKDWATEYALKDPAGFASFVEKAPQGVPMEEVAGGTVTVANKTAAADETAKICKMMGVSKDDLDKFGKEAE